MSTTVSALSSTIQLAKELISRPSITPNDADCQTLIAERLTNIGFTCEKLSYGETENLWARYGTEEPLLVFAGHTDVVPTGDIANWTSPPFTPTIRDGKLYGRGASDMKGAIASMIVAAEIFIRQQPHFKGSLAFLLTSDEEGPALDGTVKVMAALKERGIHIQYCIIGEPSSDKQVGDQIRVGRRGSLHGKLSVLGKQGHVAHPHLAINPIHACAGALHDLSHTEWDQGNNHFPPTTFQISNIHSGTGAANVIPGHLECQFNFRYGTVATTDALQARTEKILRDRGVEFALDWNVSAYPFLTQKGSLITATEQAIKTVTGLQTKLSTGGGTSDGRFIAPTGAEVVELGVSHATAHHVDECANVADLEQLTEIYVCILQAILPSPHF